MPGKAKPETPRWKRRKQPPGPVIMVKGRGARKLQRDLRASVRTQATPKAPQHGPLHQSGLYRLRYHLVPVWWLFWVLAAGLAAHALHARAIIVLLLGWGSAALVVLGARGLSPFARRMAAVVAVLTAVWVPLLGLAGWRAPLPPLLLVTWAVVAGVQAHHYRIRPEPAVEEETDDYERWNLLAAERRWNGHLGAREALPGGGRRYPVILDGIKTTIGNVTGASENVAGAWHKPMTEAYAERDPTGITSRGYLTILGTTTLQKVREWNGAGIEPTGTAIIGRYADGSPARLKFYTPRYGTRHALVSGTTGSGKSELLNLLVFIALASGYFVPVILDPQEGQSLPFWRDRCLYAAGKDACEAMLRGLHAGMLDRSRYLSSLRWDDDGIPMRGMPFFDHELTGLPVPLILMDEAHMLLSGNGKTVRQNVEKTMEIGRLGRKTGTGLWLATHLPSLSDLGGEQALRDMLRGGNVISMRTANRVAGGMLGLVKDPSEIPMFFTDGKETYGLGYVAGPDNRPDAPMRTDLVPKAMRRKPPTVPLLDARFAEAMAPAMNPPVASIPPPALVAAAPVPSEPAGGTATDAVLAVLDAEMDRGEVIERVITWCEQQGRKPYSLRAITDALSQLVDRGSITKPRHGRYAPARPALRAVPAGVSRSE